MNCLIRLASLTDAVRIQEIALSRRVSGTSQEITGLIDYPVPSIEKYKKRVVAARFYVAETDSSNVIGFMDAYTNNKLGEVFGDDPVIKEISLLSTSPFIYINTIAVLKQYEGKGVSSDLFSRLESELVGYKQIWAAIVHKPLRNIISVAVFSKAGFTFEEEIRAFEKYTFGLYKKKL
ncbi:MAG: GNAT family N-acetyltransferase [Candidatus Nanoarchaeia archaeon]|jgi:GNAT superfamily N-acetyltransferase